MMTPQEISQCTFPKASFSGYNMAAVDEFLDVLTADYNTLYKENAVLKSKMKVLVEKIEEYRSTEDAMRMALLSAQKMANSMVEEATARKEELLKQADAAAQERVFQLRHEIAAEQSRLAAAKKSTTEFVGRVRAVYQRELSFLDELPELDVPPAAALDVEPAAKPADSAMEDIEASMQHIMSAAIAEAQAQKKAAAEEPAAAQQPSPTPEDGAAEPVAVPAGCAGGNEADTDENTRRIDFSNLKFGKDYEIK